MPTTTPTIPISTAELHDMQMDGRIPEHAPVCGVCGSVIVLTDRGWRHLLRADAHPAWPNTPQQEAVATVGDPTTVNGVTTIPVTPRSDVAVGAVDGHTRLTVRSEAVGVMLTLTLPTGVVDALVDALNNYRGRR